MDYCLPCAQKAKKSAAELDAELNEDQLRLALRSMGARPSQITL